MIFSFISKKSVLLLGLALLVVFVIVGGYIGVRELSEEKDAGEAPTAPAKSGPVRDSTSEIDTSDWKVYRNEKYGFEIKYPHRYELSTTTFSRIAPAIVSYKPRAEITTSVYDNFNLLPLLEWIKSDLVIHNISVDWMTMTIAGVNSLRSPVSGNIDGGIGYGVIVPWHDKVFVLSLSTKEPGTDSETRIFEQILSSFRFIEKTK